MRRRYAAAVLLLAATPCAAWSIYAGGSSSQFSSFDFTNVTTGMESSFRWTYRRPLIRWAIAPDFCSSMYPLWSENTALHFIIDTPWQNFTSCERVHAVIRESFDVWAAANPSLQFVDVTHRCESEKLWRPIDDNRCAESTWCLDAENATGLGANYVDWKLESTPLEKDPSTPSWMCSQRTCFECDRADVIVGGFTQKNRRLGDQHAKARVQRTVVTGQPPLAPTGSAATGKTVLRGWLEFNVDDEYKNVAGDGNSLGNVTVANCWRLDNDVCDWVIAIPGFGTGRQLADTILLVFWITFGLLVCACLCLVLQWLQRLASNLLTGWDVDRDGKLELQEIVYVLDEFCGEICFECQCPSVHQKKMTALSGCISVLETILQSSVLLPLFFILVVTAISLLYADGVMKCFVCRDFRASAIHEIGHLLSLDHPTGADGTIPLLRSNAPPPPPPPMNMTTGEVYFYNETVQAALRLERIEEYGSEHGPLWVSLNNKDACDNHNYGVHIDPALIEMLSPPPLPPSPLAPPPAAPGEIVNNTLRDLAEAAAALLRPNESVINATIAERLARQLAPPPDMSFGGKMASVLDLSHSIMIEFGSIGLERPLAGIVRRCMDADDLDGINFLYPTCATELAEPPCEYVSEGGVFTGLRLFESFVKLSVLPILIMYGIKLLAMVFLFFEDCYASMQVRKEAKRLLDEAEAAEKRRLAMNEGGDSPSGKPKTMGERLGSFGLGGFGFGSSKKLASTKVEPPSETELSDKTK